MKLAASVALACALALTACGDDDGGGASKPDAARPTQHDSGDGTVIPAHDAGNPRDAASDAASSPMMMSSASRVCSADGFCWELPTPQGETLHAAWAAAPGDVWAVGDGGLVLHYDGRDFEAVESGTHQDLLAVHGSAADDVWAVGKGGVVLHYDGKVWSATDLGPLIDASGGAMTGDLNGVFAAAADAVWAVGHSGASAVIARFDGEQWTNPALAMPTEKVLRAVWGSSAEHVWAVGDGGTILEYDGAQWSPNKSPTGAALLSIHGLTDHDVWAVGAKGAVAHWNGTDWKGVNAGITTDLSCVRVDIDTEPPSSDAAAEPPPMPVDAGVDAGPAPAPMGPWRVWLFGADGRVLRYNGAVWDALPTGTTLPLRGAARIDAGELLAVGERGELLRFSGDARENLSHGSLRNHLALWGDGETLWMAGDELSQRAHDVWTEIDRPSDRSLYGVWGDDGGLWAVGTAGTVLRYQDGEVMAVDVPAARDTWLRSVYGVGNALWVVGHGGLALTSAAGGFLAIDTKVKSNLFDVWGSAEDSFWAVGEGGIVLRWDGAAWLKVPTGPMGGTVESLRAVWGSGDDDVWVVGGESTILRWDGKRFVDYSRKEHYTLNDVWGYSADDVYAVGTGGTALHWDGKDWTELESGTHSSLQAVFGDARGRTFAAGVDGVVLVREP